MAFLFDPKLSLFLPRMPNGTEAHEVVSTFQYLSLGDVCYVDIIKNKSGYWHAAVYFKAWYDTLENRQLQEQLHSVGPAGIMHGKDWLLTLNKQAAPRNMKQVLDKVTKMKSDMASKQERIIQLKYEIKSEEGAVEVMQKHIQAMEEFYEISTGASLQEIRENEKLRQSEMIADQAVENVLRDISVPPKVVVKRRQRPATPPMRAATPPLRKQQRTPTPPPPPSEASFNLLPKFMQNGSPLQYSSQPCPPARLLLPSMRRHHSVPCSVQMEIRRPYCEGCELFNQGVGGFNQEAHACLGY